MNAVIHPRTQGSGAESEFYQPWRPRARRPIESAPTLPKHMTSRLADPVFRARLQSMARRRFSDVEIGAELGVTKRTVQSYRKTLGIGSKRLLASTDDPNVNLAITLPVKLYAKIKRAGGRGGMSDFIRRACIAQLDRLDAMRVEAGR